MTQHEYPPELAAKLNELMFGKGPEYPASDPHEFDGLPCHLRKPYRIHSYADAWQVWKAQGFRRCERCGQRQTVN